MTGFSRADPLQPDERAKDTDAKRALFLEAKELTDEKGVFFLAVRSVRARWYAELMDTVERDKKADLLARLKCLDEIPREIQRFVSDYTMVMNKAKHARGN
jgi:hypothetical protein